MALTKRQVLVPVGILVAVFAAWGAFAFFRAVIDVPRQAYAVWWTADLVIEYMERHDGAWPRGWEDLRTVAEGAPEVKAGKERDGAEIVEFRPGERIEELRRIVEVDWDADPAELVKLPRNARGSPFRVITLRNGKSRHYEGKEPNQMILDYLLSRQQRDAKRAEPVP
jgi:hypothetical protein